MSKQKLKLLSTPVLDIIQSAIKTAEKQNKKRKNFFEIANILPRNGEGFYFRNKKVAAPDSRILLETIELAPDGGHGKSFGAVTYAGRKVTCTKKMGSTLKRGIWCYVPEEKIKERELFLEKEKIRKDIIEKVKEQTAQRRQQQQ